MNCFELRRSKLATPRELNAEAEAHLRECPACAAFAAKLDVFEEALESEVRTPVPDGLADRVLLQLQQRTNYPHAEASTAERVRAVARNVAKAEIGLTHWWGWRTGFAVVATLVVGVSIVLFNAWPVQDQGLAIADIAHDAHVMQERLEDLGDAPATDPGALPSVLAASGIRLPSDFREIRYVGPCGPADRTGQHIVMQTQSGMASLVLMPGESARFRIVQFDDGRTVVVAPAAVGSLAVVADSRETAVQIAARLL
jgi:hypothetical protein